MTAIPTYENVADVEAAAQRMRAFYATGATLDVAYRRRALEQMRAYLKANEERVLAALTADLGKAPFEGMPPSSASSTTRSPPASST